MGLDDDFELSEDQLLKRAYHSSTLAMGPHHEYRERVMMLPALKANHYLWEERKRNQFIRLFFLPLYALKGLVVNVFTGRSNRMTY